MSVLLSSDTPGLPRINCFNVSEAAFSLDVDECYLFKLKLNSLDLRVPTQLSSLTLLFDFLIKTSLQFHSVSLSLPIKLLIGCNNHLRATLTTLSPEWSFTGGRAAVRLLIPFSVWLISLARAITNRTSSLVLVGRLYTAINWLHVRTFWISEFHNHCEVLIVEYTSIFL